jgi:hypothetical protein
MPRRYEIIEPSFLLVTNAAMDLMQIKNAVGSNKMLKIVRWWWSSVDNILTTAQMLQIKCAVFPATVTDGSGGATPTPRPLDPGDVAATFTALSRNTVQATTSGTARIYDDQARHIYNGYEQQIEEGPWVPPASSFIFYAPMTSLLGAPRISCGVEVDEYG